MKLKYLILFVVLSFGLCSCGPYSKTALKVGSPGTIVPPVPQEYRIAIGDKLNVKLFYNPELNQEVTVRPDGKISLMLVHEINAAGLTASELTKLLTESYAKFLQQPEVAVIVNSFGGQRIFVGGEVALPGARDLIGPTTVLQAVAMAGGFKESARLNEVIILRRDENSKPAAISVDIEKAMKGVDLEQDIFLQPYDIVLVPKSNIANVDLWVQQYLTGTIGWAGQSVLYYEIFK